MEVFKKIINITIDVLVIFVFIFSALIAVLSITSNSDGVSNLFGIAPLNVKSN